MSTQIHDRKRIGPKAGEPAANGQGVFVVKKVTGAQARYIQNLLDSRVPGPNADSVFLTAVQDFRNGELNKRFASDLIDWLLKQPRRDGSGTTTRVVEAPATDKQKNLIRKMTEELGLPVHDSKINGLTKKEASEHLDGLFTMQRNMKVNGTLPKKASKAELEAGMYRTSDGRIFKVQKAVHGSGRMYAKELVTHGHGDAEFVYARGIVHTLDASQKLSLEDAKKYGALYGSCIVCARTLTNEESIAAGIGPVCGGRLA
jgi:hypothetical protein